MTIQEAKDQIARNHSFTEWQHLLKAHSGRLDYFINEVAHLVHSEACREQREICAGVAEFHVSSTTAKTLSKAIKNAHEPKLL